MEPILIFEFRLQIWNTRFGLIVPYIDGVSEFVVFWMVYLPMVKAVWRASGVIAGRAIWAEAVKLTGEDRTRFLQTVGVERMQRLVDVCWTQGKSWQHKSTLPTLENG